MNTKKVIWLLAIIIVIVSLIAIPSICIDGNEKDLHEGWVVVDVNVKTTPSHDSEILGTLSMGEPITFWFDSEKWVAINYSENEIAYISTDYITTDGTVIDYLMFVNKLEIEPNEETFSDYKDFINEHSDEYDLPETIYDYYTEYEIELMLQCIETETYDKDFLSKVNVANVILNRLSSEKFAESPIEVITSPNQFAYHRDDIEESTRNALEYAFLFKDTTQGALYFHSGEPRETFNGATYIFTDLVGHHFYK